LAKFSNSASKIGLFNMFILLYPKDHSCLGHCYFVYHISFRDSFENLPILESIFCVITRPLSRIHTLEKHFYITSNFYNQLYVHKICSYKARHM